MYLCWNDHLIIPKLEEIFQPDEHNFYSILNIQCPLVSYLICNYI